MESWYAMSYDYRETDYCTDQCCYCHTVEWRGTSEPYYLSCECQFRNNVKVVNLGGAGLMLVEK